LSMDILWVNKLDNNWV